MSTLAVLSANAKSSLLEAFDSQAELKNKWASGALANMDALEGQDLAECVLIATIQGRESFVRTLMQRRGPVSIAVDENFEGYRLNGSPISVSPEEFGAYSFSPKALKSVVAMIHEYGMKGLLEPGTSFPLLLQRLDSNRFMYSNNDSQFTGELPSLTQGLLQRPELAMTLAEESMRVSTPGAYQPLLCWASGDMVEQFRAHLAPLMPVQEVGGTPMREWKEKSGEPYNMAFHDIVLGMRDRRGHTSAIHTLMSAMAPESAKFGFKDEKGRHLCQTTADFLLSFPKGACTADNLKAASTFVENYCPIQIMALNAAEVCHREFGLAKKVFSFKDHTTKRLTQSFNYLFEALDATHPLHKRVKKMMTPEQWTGLLHKARAITGESLVALQQTFGIDNTGKNLELSFRDFQILSQRGYRFADNTKAYDNFSAYMEIKVGSSVQAVHLNFTPASFNHLPPEAKNHTLHSYVLDIYQCILKTNLWPGTGKAPADVGEALDMAASLILGETQDTLSVALEAYLVGAGLDACLAVTSTPSQWVTLTQIFSSAELEPYIKAMPAKARGRMLELSMGI
jgi:hypothetical protein